MAAAAKVSATVRKVAYGQDVSRMRGRKGKKAWRAEHAATADDKESGRCALDEMRSTYPLHALNLEKVSAGHVMALKEKIDTGDPKARSGRIHRLRQSLLARERRATMRVVMPVIEYALPICEEGDFVSYVVGREHGDRVEIEVPRSSTPYLPGEVPGAPLRTPPLRGYQPMSHQLARVLLRCIVRDEEE